MAAALPAVAAVSSMSDSPLQSLRAAYELVALDQGMTTWLDISDEDLAGKALTTVAVFPTVVAAL